MWAQTFSRIKCRKKLGLNSTKLRGNSVGLRPSLYHILSHQRPPKSTKGQSCQRLSFHSNLNGTRRQSGSQVTHRSPARKPKKEKHMSQVSPSGSTVCGGPTLRRTSRHSGSASIASSAVSGRHWRSIRAARRQISTPTHAASFRTSECSSVPFRRARRRPKDCIKRSASGCGRP